jgi:UDP-N-acetylglucosamine 2-epimerase (non-hydrolysing)
MERPEAQDAGTIILTGFDQEIVIDSIKITLQGNVKQPLKQMPSEYSVRDTSWRVLKLIQGLSSLSNRWHGVNSTL